ncbi:MAG: 16S rRNA (guanine(527)-N(7))-methyltransferase RsmG [Erysipelotrichaceae bacterium]|nr:16S rRNA (guanine(527)-N(7))-methyltransferase RsmG [Erysipelotrichaceae bacterium]
MAIRKMLLDGMIEMGFHPTEEMLDQFEVYKTLLLDWNTRINLTTITDDEDIVCKHFLDSLTCLMGPVDFNGKKVLDLGTGAGFPGVPLKILEPSIKITLMDSLNKRIKYLDTLCLALSLKEVVCLHARAEEAAREKTMRENFDIVVSRAVANLSTLAEYCLPFVRVDGYFIAQKTNEAIDEIHEAEKAIQILGGSKPQIIKVSIPNTNFEHNLVIIRKTRPTPSVYPRKAGTPAKQPIR